jgi:hypothetical protein
MRSGVALLARLAAPQVLGHGGGAGGEAAAAAAAAAAGASLQQQLELLRARADSGRACSTSAAAGSGSRSGSGPSTPAGSGAGGSSAGALRAWAWPAAPGAPPLVRGYARAVRPPPARGPRGDGDGESGGGGEGSGGGGGGRFRGGRYGGGGFGSGGPRDGRFAPRAATRTGRLAANCPPLSALPASRAAAAAAAWRPWASHGPLNDRGPPGGGGEPGPMPFQIDTEPGEDHLEYSLALRESIESSTLPPELKRAAFDQPWHELLVDARRTVKVRCGAAAPRARPAHGAVPGWPPLPSPPLALLPACRRFLPACTPPPLSH